MANLEGIQSDNLNADLVRSAKSGIAANAQSSADPSKASNLSCRVSRRRLLQLGAGAGIAAALAPMPRLSITRAFASEPAVPKAPNIVVLMTDQERHHMH